MERREFIKLGGSAAAAAALAGTAVTAAAGLVTGCGSKGKDTDGEDGRKRKHNGGAEENGGEGGMTYRTDPKTGEKVSVLGYGCMRWQMKKDENGKDIIDQDSVNELVDYALAHGINYFDSSPVYLQGQSEAATGLALSRHPRESYLIATKLSNFSNWTRENSLLMYRKSFENFRTDYIDYYLLHSIGRSVEDFENRYVKNGMLDFLMKEREAGRIRHLGFSFHGNKDIFDELLKTHEKYHWDFVQIQLNYLDWDYASGRNTNASHLYEQLHARNIPMTIMEPLLGGRLAKVSDNVAAKLMERDPVSSIASWAFRFAGSPEGVLCVLSGMTYMEHLQDNLKTYSPLKPLTEDDLKFLKEVADLIHSYPTVPCNDCKYCMPCPYGIDIPAILLHYNKCVNAGLVVPPPEENDEDYAGEMKAYRKARRAYLVSYGRSVEKIRQANRCIGCGQCVEHCPQSIQIPRELQRIDRLVESLRRQS